MRRCYPIGTYRTDKILGAVATGKIVDSWQWARKRDFSLRFEMTVRLGRCGVRFG